MSDPSKKRSRRSRVFRILIYTDIFLILFFFCLMFLHRNSLYERLHPSSQVTVHITRYGEKYHDAECQYLHSSDISITLYKARERGYSRCSVCYPPSFVLQYDAVDTWPEYIAQGYGGEFLSLHPGLFFVAFLFIPIVLSTRILTNNSDSKIAVAPAADAPAPVPYQDRPVSPTYTTCHHIWISTYHIARHLGITNNLMLHGYIWAAMFYITTKYIRDQKTINEIYRHFDSASTGIADPEPYPPDMIHYVSFNYRYFAPILNQSGIDPRTPSGLDELWTLLCKNVHRHKEPFPSAYQAFIDYTSILIADASKYSTP